MNELTKVLALLQAFEASGLARGAFARRKRLHPSAFSRLLKVRALPPEVLAELATLERLSRTHLEVIATASPEKRPAVIAAVREGRSTYTLRDRRETKASHSETEPRTGSSVSPSEELTLVQAALGASSEETVAFALELLALLLRSGRARVEASFESFRVARGARRSA